MTISIIELKPGDVVRICGYNQSQSVCRRKLLAMGLTKGAIFTVQRIAPLGDPIQIKLRNFFLTLRKKEAELLQIERVNT